MGIKQSQNTNRISQARGRLGSEDWASVTCGLSTGHKRGYREPFGRGVSLRRATPFSFLMWSPTSAVPLWLREPKMGISPPFKIPSSPTCSSVWTAGWQAEPNCSSNRFSPEKVAQACSTTVIGSHILFPHIVFHLGQWLSDKAIKE